MQKHDYYSAFTNSVINQEMLYAREKYIPRSFENSQLSVCPEERNKPSKPKQPNLLLLLEDNV